MTTYDLAISGNYIPNWGVKEGVRELIQNAIDGHNKGFTKEIRYVPSSGTLYIINKGITLSPRSLVLGEGDKMGDNSQLGEFGEGYKLACLCLLRLGKDIRILNGNEIWIPSFSFSDKFKTDILKVKTSKNNNPENSIIFKIKKISEKEWEECQSTHLDYYFDYAKKETEFGDVLKGESVNGKVFVGDLFIQSIKDLKFGYNFKPKVIKTNRDRSLIDTCYLYAYTCRMWNQLAKLNWKNYFIDLVNQDASDVNYSIYYFDDTARKVVKEHFEKSNGSDAFPIYNEQKVGSLAYLGLKPVSVSKTSSELLRNFYGSIEDKIKEVNESPSSEVLFLNENETQNLNQALAFVHAVTKKRYRVKVVTFNGDVKAKFSSKEQLVYMDKSLLATFKDCLMWIIHEYSHDIGGEGDPVFYQEERDTWANVLVWVLKEKGCFIN